VTSKNIGIIHVDRHADIQETDLDERMHTTPYFHATNIPNVPAKNLVQIGIGGWQVGGIARMAGMGWCRCYLSVLPQHGLKSGDGTYKRHAWRKRFMC